MLPRLLITLLLLITVVTIILMVIKNRKQNNTNNVKKSSQKFGLSSSIGSTDFANDKEAKKMTLPLVLKNTIMSLKPLKPSPLDRTNYIFYGISVTPMGNGEIPIENIITDTTNDLVMFLAQDESITKAVSYTGSTGIIKDIRSYYGRSSTWNITPVGPNDSSYGYNVKIKGDTNRISEDIVKSIYALHMLKFGPYPIDASDYIFYGPYVSPMGNGEIPLSKIVTDINNDLVIFAAQDGGIVKAVVYTGSTGIIKDTRWYNGDISSINTPQQPAWNILPVGPNDSSYGYNVRIKSNANKITSELVKYIYSKAGYNNISFYPSIIREGLFYIKTKGTNQYIYKNSSGVLEIRDEPVNFNDFSSKYQSGILENGTEQPMPFFLKFKEKDELNKEYTFYAKSFLGDIGNENSFKNIGTKPFYQAGYKLTARFDRGCYPGHEGGFTGTIEPGEKFKNLYSDAVNSSPTPGFWSDTVDWYSMPPGLKGTAWWDNFSGNVNYLATNTQSSSNLCPGGGSIPRDRWDTIKIEYDQPDIPCLSIIDSESDDSSCEFKFVYDENGNLHVEKYGKYLSMWYSRFPVFNDNYNQRAFIELVPVLNTKIEDGNLAERYYKASMEFLKKDDGKTALANFCGSYDTFNDGTKKIYPTTDDLPPSDIIEKAFSSICDCNMDKAYYSKLLCPDIMIQTQYGLDPSEPTFKQYANQIRGTIKCEEPNCRFNKCYNWYEQPPPEGGSIRSLFIDAPGTDYTPSRECGGTICITNQKVLLEQGATLQNSPVIFDNITSCGGEEYKPTTEELGDLIIDNKVLKKQVRCKVKDKVVNNTAKGCNPNGFIKYLDFTTSKIVSNTVNSQTGERVIKISGVISDKENITPEELKMQIDFIKSNISTSS